MTEFRRIGQHEFLARYANSRPPVRFYVLDDDGRPYPMKALWAASFIPRIMPRHFNSSDAIAGFKARGYEIASLPGSSIEDASAVLDFQAHEGERYLAEVIRIRRNARIVAEAKAHYGAICQACDFDFEEFYGERGRDFIECHHVDPLYGRDGEGEVTTIEDLAMLCSNCHRMVHRTKLCLTVDELREMIDKAA
ncbi:HNH endonuclease [Mesorhizobium sp. M0050]|uniref:HNH endonuclease n=1 Tax=Mesorhizobium sp. M0050 TaxID=2956861 RepID=UPI00333C6AEE